MGIFCFFNKEKKKTLDKGLEKTKSSVFDKLTRAVAGKSKVDDDVLDNAAEYTPEEGTIWLEFKKRSAHTLQFLVANTGSTIPEEKREDIFKPFLEIRDLTEGDGLGLPICKQMARKMNGDLEIDAEFTKGVRFVLELHV